MPKSKDTIFALSTAFAKSAIAIVRISGPEAKAALIALTGKKDFVANEAQPTVLRSPATNEIIDQALAIFFAGPKSVTGEDVVELHLHGSLAVIREVLDILSTLDGLRPAEPGEFSKRAFMNGKMDLTQVEAIADLIDAETKAQKTQALRQMQGDLSRYYDELRTSIVKALAHLEAYIDFPDEEIPESVLGQLKREREGIIALINSALSDHQRGEKVRDGIHIVILGAPNVGKSSLLNALAGREAAIVSHRAGTTRDAIEVHMDIAGFPVVLTDTAGLRESADEIEEEGIRRAKARASQADIKLVLFDAEQLPAIDEGSKALIDDNTLIIINKIDKMPAGQGANANKLFNNSKLPVMAISTQTGQGIDIILNSIEKTITSGFSSQSAPVITRARHRALLSQALENMERFSPNSPLELACEELRRAATSVGKITGKIQVDDVLDVVFKAFCIGK